MSEKISNQSSLLLNGFVHILILFLFLTLLYFIVISPLIEKSFNSEIENNIKPPLSKSIKKIPESVRKDISEALDVKIDDKKVIDKLIEKYSETDKIKVEHNRWVKITSITVISIIFLGLLISVIVIKNGCNKEVGIFDIVKENIITFFFIGIVEYLFFMKIASKFVPAPPSLLVNSLLDTFKNKL